LQTMTTRAAIYCKTSTALAYSTLIADLERQIADSGCILAKRDYIFGDTNNALNGLTELVFKAQNQEFQVVFVSHDLPASNRKHYNNLIGRLYQLGVSVIICQ
jgi:hypothetical protein